VREGTPRGIADGVTRDEYENIFGLDMGFVFLSFCALCCKSTGHVYQSTLISAFRIDGSALLVSNMTPPPVLSLTGVG